MAQVKCYLLILCVMCKLSMDVAYGITLDFDQVLKQALHNSYDLKIAQVNIGISKTGVISARSEYFPVIQARASLERLKGLQTLPGNVTTIGTMVLPTGTRYQETVGLSLTHTLYDFGVRKRKLAIAKKDVQVNTSTYEQQLRDFKFSLIDAYVQALISYKSLKANEVTTLLAQDVFQMKKRLYQASVIPKTELAEEAINLAQALDNQEEARQKLAENLQALSGLTRQEYEPSDIEILNFQDEALKDLPAFSQQLTPEAKMYEMKIKQKQDEVEFLKRQYMPQVSVYSYYNLYGYNIDHMSRALQNLGPRTVSMGLSVTLPVFDGFKNYASIKKAELEKQKLVLQRDQKLADLKNQARLLEKQAKFYSVQLKTKATIVNKTQDKMSMLKQLSDEQLVEKTQTTKAHIQRIQHQVEVESAMIQSLAAIKKLQLLAAGQS
jgi:outer membrane protein TolC